MDNVRGLVDTVLGPECDLQIIDVLESPDLAETEKIFATPTLIKEIPPPPRRIIGDMSDTARVLEVLGKASHTLAGKKEDTE